MDGVGEVGEFGEVGVETASLKWPSLADRGRHNSCSSLGNECLVSDIRRRNTKESKSAAFDKYVAVVGAGMLTNQVGSNQTQTRHGGPGLSRLGRVLSAHQCARDGPTGSSPKMKRCDHAKRQMRVVLGLEGDAKKRR